VLRIEDEYYTNKIPEEVGDGSNTGVALQPRTDASNGYVVGAIDSEDWVDFAIDVPTAGDYTITMLYYNELKSGQTSANTHMQFLANGTSLVVEDVPETVAGQTTPTSYTFAQTIHLNAGRNVIRQMMVVPRVESLRTTPYFDAFELTLVQPFQMARKALAIAGGLAEAGAADLTDLNVVTTGDSATVIDLLDAVELVRQGK
jgi:hypothetical protein